MAGSFAPHLAFLDLGMPEVDGYEACRRIRAQPGGETLIIIAQTGWGQQEDRQRTREAGFDHHMVKPLDPHALQRLLADLPPRKG
jgi:CheY-like chemotaxis protein